MRTFLIKTGCALLIVGLFHLAAAFMADGSTDPYYLRFTVPRQKSLVLGGSRSAQGLHPAVFNDADRAGQFTGPLYNFSFTIAHSPYGPTYLDAVRQVLDTSARNGLFILQVDPWQLASSKEDPDDGMLMLEKERALGVQWTWRRRPNHEYLVRHWDAGWGALGHWPRGDPDTTMFVRDDGQLELHIPMDPVTVKERTRRMVANNRSEFLAVLAPSSRRLASLREMMELLKPHGRVILLRMPVHPEFAAMEAELDRDFDRKLDSLARASRAPYWTYSGRNGEFTYTDGSHLDRSSGERFSLEIAGRVAAMP